MRSRNENYKALRIPFYFRPGGGTFAQLTQARFTKKQMVTFPDRSEGIVKVST